MCPTKAAHPASSSTSPSVHRATFSGDTFTSREEKWIFFESNFRSGTYSQLCTPDLTEHKRMSSTQRSWTIDPDLDGLDLDPDDYHHSVPLKKVPAGDIFEAARAGDLDRLRYLIDSGVNINARDAWDSVALYYTCLAGHIDAARMLLENGAICSEHTFDGDRCHYAALNLSVRKLLKVFEARPPPLGALEGALRDTFLDCRANRVYPDEADNYNSLQNAGYASTNEGLNSYYFPPDVIFFVQGRPIEAHRAILSSRSPFFKKRFATKWKDRREIRFAGAKLSHPALYSFIHFFYSDRLEIVVDEIESLVEICKVCKCESLQKILEKEMILLKHAEYKALVEVDSSQKRFILQGLSLPEEDRLSECLHQLLQVSLANSNQQNTLSVVDDERIGDNEDDLADVYVRVGYRKFRCHQVILASRSEYFKARLSRMANFLEGKDGVPCNSLPSIEEHDISIEAFEKMLEYMYTDRLKDIDPDQAEEMFDASSRYLMFPLKRAVADALLPHLEMESPAELCHWLILSDMYGVLKIREYCLDAIACNFETFADTTEFRSMLLTLPPPSGDSSMRTTLPSAPGANVDSANHGNLLDDLREKWLEAEAAELDKRDESAALFDKRLEMLMLVAERENTAMNSGGT